MPPKSAKIMEAAQSCGGRRAYATALGTFRAFKPPRPTTLEKDKWKAFAESRSTAGLSPATAKNALYALRREHVLQEQDSWTTQPWVDTFLRGLKNIDADTRQRKREPAPFPFVALSGLAEYCKNKGCPSVGTACLLAFHCLLRQEMIPTINRQRIIVFRSEGVSSAEIHLIGGKGEKHTSSHVHRVVDPLTLRLLEDEINLAKIEDRDLLFPGWSEAKVNATIKEFARGNGWPVDEWDWTFHSLRSGGEQHMERSGKDRSEVCMQGRWSKKARNRELHYQPRLPADVEMEISIDPTPPPTPMKARGAKRARASSAQPEKKRALEVRLEKELTGAHQGQHLLRERLKGEGVEPWFL